MIIMPLSAFDMHEMPLLSAAAYFEIIATLLCDAAAATLALATLLCCHTCHTCRAIFRCRRAPFRRLRH